MRSSLSGRSSPWTPTSPFITSSTFTTTRGPRRRTARSELCSARSTTSQPPGATASFPRRNRTPIKWALRCRRRDGHLELDRCTGLLRLGDGGVELEEDPLNLAGVRGEVRDGHAQLVRPGRRFRAEVRLRVRVRLPQLLDRLAGELLVVRVPQVDRVLPSLEEQLVVEPNL